MNNNIISNLWEELANQPKLLGTYGVATISGIARKINQELIIAGMR